MKKNIWLILCLLMPIIAPAQTQQGVSYQYNGEKSRTPLGNVTISYDNNRRTIISNEKDGSFCLALTNKKMGDRIGPVTVKKREMMVFNQHAVDEWSVRKEPLMLILCNADEFERQKANLIEIGRREAKKKYDKQKAELEAELNASQIKQQEYETALDQAYDELERFHKNVGEYADLFARIDESEIDTLAQQAIELYKSGDIDHAIELFEKGNYLEELKQDKLKIQQYTRLAETAQQAKDKAEQAKQKHIQSIEAQIKAYQAQGDIKKAQLLYKAFVDELDDMLYYLSYATFCSDNEIYSESLLYLDKMQKMAEDSIALHKNDFYLVKSNILEIKAGLYSQTGNLEKFEETINSLIQYCRMMAETAEYQDFQNYPYQYKRALTRNLLMAGVYYHNFGNTEQTIRMLKQSVAISKDIAIREPSDINVEDYYLNLLNAGNILNEINCYDEYEKMLLCAWESGNKIKGLKKYADSYLTEVSMRLSRLYLTIDQDEKAVFFLKETINRSKDNNNETDLYLNALYLLQHFASTPQESYKTGMVLLPLLKKTEDDSESWKDSYSESLGSLAYNAILLKKYDEAEQHATKGLKVDPTKHWIVTNLAAALLFQGKYTEAEKLYRQFKDELKEGFLDDFKQFAEAGVIPKKYEADVEKIKRILEE